jgi:hypothetical protein
MPKPLVKSFDQIMEAALDGTKPGARTRDIAEAIVDRCNSSLEPLSREWAIEDLTLLLRRRRAQRTRAGKKTPKTRTNCSAG